MNALRAAIVGLAGLLLAGGLAGCGGKADANAGASGRLAARVNGTEITMQQVGVRSAGGPHGPLQALDKVIDRELLVQKALEAKLDREPRIVQAIEEARRQVLAQAWLERTAAERVRPSGEEVRAFYEENPALFAQRRVYKIREITVAGAADRLEMLRAELVSARDLEDVAGWLKWRNLKVSAVTGTTQAAEHLPLGYLPQLARMKEGELAVFPSSLGATVIQLVHAQQAPLSEREATPLIEQFLSGRKRLELAAAEVKRLRGAASIEYVGDFKR
jgi:EpsD family peptidyl-prolyl cis-trans isomerase